jgi:transcriptional regulator with XRE-family HTH domain
MYAIAWPQLLREARTRSGLSQRELAERAGTTQSVVGRIEAGLTSPRVDTVDRLLEAAGYRLAVELRPIGSDPVIAAYKADIDRTLLRENMRLSPEERVRALQSLHRLATEARVAGARLRKRR